MFPQRKFFRTNFQFASNHSLSISFVNSQSDLQNNSTNTQLNIVYDMCHNKQAVVLHAEAVSSYLR